MESDCSIAEKDVKLVEDNPDDEEVTVQVQPANVQEGKHPLCDMWMSGW